MQYAPLPLLTEQMELALEQGETAAATAQSAELWAALPDDPPVRRLRRAALPQDADGEPPWKEREEASPTRCSTNWAILGLAQFTLHRFADSEASLRRALTADPSNPFALATMAVLLHERRQDDKAFAVTRLLEGTPGTAELIDEIRQEARQRQTARQLVERNAFLEPQRTPGFSLWVWLGVWLLLGGVTFLLFQPQTPLGYLLCAGAPLGVVALLRRLFS